MKIKPVLTNHSALFKLLCLGCVLVLLAGLSISALAAAGDLDPTFGILSSGINYTDIDSAENHDQIFALALQTDNMIVAAGESNNHFALARYDVTGLLDTAGFGATNGTVTTVINTSSLANGVAVQEDGSIVAVGSSTDGTRDYFTVARYLSDGTLDTAGFNAPNGYIISTLTAGNDVATAVVIQNDGKIVVGGYTDNRFVVARYTSAGVLDTTTFAAPNGFRTITIGTSDVAQAIGLQSDGRIILAGHADTGTSDDFAVARFTTSGALDTTFNGGLGYITTDFPTQRIDLAQALDIQADDKIVVAGYSKTGVNDDFALARYNANGTLDTAFGTNGRVVTAIGADDDQAFAVAVQPTGHIIVAGTSVDAATNEDFAVARYTSGGVVDTSLGDVGYVTNNIGDSLDSGAITADFVEAVVIQSDGKIVVGGYTDHPVAFGDDNFAIARYESPNNAPGVTDIAKTGSEDTLMTFTRAEFTAQFDDVDGDSLVKVQITSLPANGTLQLSGVDVLLDQEIYAWLLGNLTFMPDANFNGDDTFGWNGSDGLDYAATGAAVNITLSAVNDTPVNNMPTAFNLDEDTSQAGVIFNISDVDAGSATDFQFTLSALHANLTLTTTAGLTLVAGGNGSHLMTYQGPLADINAALGDVAYAPDANYNGSDAITLTANDNGNTGSGGAKQDTDQVAVTVNSVNDDPVLDPIGNQVGNEGTTITFDANASDVDSGQVLTFSLEPGAPTGASINPSSGVFTWGAGEADGPGIYTVTVDVSDSITFDSESLQIRVNEVNAAPVLVAIGNRGVNEDALLTFTAAANDVDIPTNTLTYTLDTGAPAGAAIDPSSGVFTWTPGETDSPGVYLITVVVTDNGVPVLSDTETLQITVNEVNDAPTFAGGPNQAVDEDSGVQTVPAWASAITPGTADEAAQTLAFHVSTDNAALFSVQPAITTAGALSYTPAANANGTAAITVTLQDNGGTANGGVDTSSPYHFTISLNPVNDVPLVSDVTRQSETGEITFALADFTAAFSDVDGDALATIQITALPANGVLRLNGVAVVAGQTLTANQATISQLTFTPNADWGGRATFGWNGSDGTSYAVTDALVIVSIPGYQIYLPIILR